MRRHRIEALEERVAFLEQQLERASEGIVELQGLSTDMAGQGEALLSHLEGTGAGIADLLQRVGGLREDADRVRMDTSELSDRLDILGSTMSAVERGLLDPRRDQGSKQVEGTGWQPVVSGAVVSPIDRLVAESVYAALESAFRGSPDLVGQRQMPYLDLVQGLPDSGPVADLGCGRGEFLDLLKEAGIPGIGVEQSSVFAGICRDRGLDIREQDLLEYLGEQEDASLRGVVSLQVLEHLSFPDLLRTFAEAYRVLTPGGLFLGETPNGANLAVGGSTFWLDHTHVRPLHPVLLHHLAEFYGFVDVRVDLVTEPQVPWRLEPETGGGKVAEAVLGLQEYVLSGQDALLVAYRPT